MINQCNSKKNPNLRISGSVNDNGGGSGAEDGG